MNEIHPKSTVPSSLRGADARARAMGSPGDEDIVASLADERRRVEELREKLRGAVKKGKAFEREKESLRRALDEARASKALENESASKALETKKLVVLAELESFKARDGDQGWRSRRAVVVNFERGYFWNYLDDFLSEQQANKLC